EDIAAVREERAIALTEVDVTRVELREVRDELGCGHPLSRHEVLDLRDELVVGEPAQRGEEFIVHARFYHADLPRRDRGSVDCELLTSCRPERFDATSNRGLQSA